MTNRITKVLYDQVRLNPFYCLLLATLLSIAIQSGCAGITDNKPLTGPGDSDSAAPSIISQPTSQAIPVGGSATFLVVCTGAEPFTYQWKKGGISIKDATLPRYTIRKAIISDNSSHFAVTITNTAGSADSDIATLLVDPRFSSPPRITVRVTPDQSELPVESPLQFVGQISGTDNSAAIWTVAGPGCSGAACGTISADGLYLSPVTVPAPPVVTVVATSLADSTKSASASVVIVATLAASVSISPVASTVSTSGTQLFIASVTGLVNKAIRWSLSDIDCGGVSCGTLSTRAASAVYSAPAALRSAPEAKVNVVATSIVEPSKSASARVTVVPAPPAPRKPTISGALPGASVGGFYAATLAASGATPPYAWSVASGQLPRGLTLSQRGQISGTPTSAGTFIFMVQVKDSAKSPQTAIEAESITVASAAPNILWNADMESGDLSKWSANYGGLVDNFAGGTAAASADYAHSGHYSAKLTLNGDVENAEMHHWKESRDSQYFDNGLYYGAWLYIPAPFYMTKDTAHGNFYNFMQFLSGAWTPANGCNDSASTGPKQWMVPWEVIFQNRTPQTPSPLYIMLNWGSGHTPVTGPYANSNQSIKQWTSTLQPGLNVPIGRWFHLQIYLKQWPHDVLPYRGRIMVWQDGVLMFDAGGPDDPNGGITTKPGNDLDGTNLCHGTDDPSWNAYSDGVNNYPSSIYVDDVQISPDPVYSPQQ